MGGPATIDGKEHKETDNFLPCQFTVNGVTFCSSENYYQWTKAINDKDRENILRAGPGITAWQAGNSIVTRPDWEEVKVEQMFQGNLAKYQQNEDLRASLLSTGKKAIIFRGSTRFWNYWNGLIQERIRAELRQQDEGDIKRAEEIKQLMNKYAEEQRLKASA